MTRYPAFDTARINQVTVEAVMARARAITPERIAAVRSEDVPDAIFGIGGSLTDETDEGVALPIVMWDMARERDATVDRSDSYFVTCNIVES